MVDSDNPHMILAALDKRSEAFDPQLMLEDLQNQLGRIFLYKRMGSLEAAIDITENDAPEKVDRWQRLTILIVDRATLMDAYPLGSSNDGRVPALFDFKEKRRAFATPFFVVGISVGNNFKELLERYGCDATCDPGHLATRIAALLRDA